MAGCNTRFLANFRRFAVAGVWAIGGVVLWIGLAVTPAQAQAPVFEISVLPQADYAQTGQPLTYTVVITNTESESPPNIVVKLPIPAGSTFLDTKFTNPNWLTGNSAGNMVWFSQQPVPAGQTDRFQLVVKVTASAGQALVVDDYQVIVLNSPDGTILASGPAVRIPILADPPPPTPSPSPAPVAATNTPTAIPPAIAADTSPTPAETALADSNAAARQSVRFYTILLIGLAVLVAVVALVVAIFFRLIKTR